jgi:hypothetical protein
MPSNYVLTYKPSQEKVSKFNLEKIWIFKETNAFFNYEEIRSTSERADVMEDSPIIRGRGWSKKTIGQTMKKDLEK